MKSRLAPLILFLLAALAAPLARGSAAGRQTPAPEAPRPGQRLERVLVPGNTSPSLFDNVVNVLEKRYYDERFRKEELPRLAARYAERARAARTLEEKREVIQEMLSHIPASHLGLLSRQTHRYLAWDLTNRPYPNFGFQLIENGGQLYAFAVLEGGPAARAGLLAWDRIVSVDGIETRRSPRLDWRSDDAYIGDERDPAVHFLIAREGETVRVRVERRRGKFLDLAIAAEPYTAIEAARASARVLTEGGRRFGYVHFWYIHMTGVPELLREKLDGEFAACDGLIIDLRGRGGNALAIGQILKILRADRDARRRPIVALVDRQSRSAKDVLAYEFKREGLARLVGEPTAGAVIPATFADVGSDSILMFPSMKLARYTEAIEMKPVQPDVPVERAGPLSGGRDPILKAGLAEALRLVKAAGAKQGVAGGG